MDTRSEKHKISNVLITVMENYEHPKTDSLYEIYYIVEDGIAHKRIPNIMANFTCS